MAQPGLWGEYGFSRTHEGHVGSGQGQPWPLDVLSSALGGVLWVTGPQQGICGREPRALGGFRLVGRAGPQAQGCLAKSPSALPSGLLLSGEGAETPKLLGRKARCWD